MDTIYLVMAVQKLADREKNWCAAAYTEQEMAAEHCRRANAYVGPHVRNYWDGKTRDAIVDILRANPYDRTGNATWPYGDGPKYHVRSMRLHLHVDQYMEEYNVV